MPTERTEFGQPRTFCACKVCVTNCKVMPGFLIPADLERMHLKAMQLLPWAEMALRASPGALVAQGTNLFRIPTLVPAKKPEGCIFLLGRQCGIHPIAPFGCAFFDCKPDTPERDKLARDGLMAVFDAWRDQSSDYKRVWMHLFDRGFIAEAPEVLRRQMT